MKNYFFLMIKKIIKILKTKYLNVFRYNFTYLFFAVGFNLEIKIYKCRGDN